MMTKEQRNQMTEDNLALCDQIRSLTDAVQYMLAENLFGDREGPVGDIYRRLVGVKWKLKDFITDYADAIMGHLGCDEEQLEETLTSCREFRREERQNNKNVFKLHVADLEHKKQSGGKQGKAKKKQPTRKE